MEKKIIEKPDFYRLLAREAGFTLEDTKDFWSAVEKVFRYAVANESILSLKGFGKLYYADIPGSTPEKPAWDGLNKRWYQRPPTKRIVLKLSLGIRESLEKDSEEDKED